MKLVCNHIILGILLALLAAACIDPYQPQTSTEDINLLVVDGFLNSSDGSATVRLSHATALADENGIESEPNASVSIVTETGNAYPLTEQQPGTYLLAGLSIDPSVKYRLSIVTKDNSTYQSEYVAIKETPPIDSITWDYTDAGLTVRVTTHDESARTKYYRWEYIETWEYHAAVASDYIMEKKVPRYRRTDELIYKCWRTEPSTAIRIASSERLSEDLIYHFPLAYIPKESLKISAGYSILVRQSAISKSEYDFLEQLRKTTESIGGLFDPQPSQVEGNISNLNDPNAPVLGFFSAGAAKEQRLFIRYLDLPEDLKKRSPIYGCQVDTMCVASSEPLPFMCSITLKNATGNEILGSALYSGQAIIGYTLSSPACADCRTAGRS